jgi:DNA invertase Pin-like site-specific DNA recombinase
MNCATYLRVSTTDQSVESQRIELATYAAAKGWTILEEFEDVGSGAKRDRPRLEALMEGVAAGEFEAVICVKLDRMARSLSHLVQIVEDLEAAGVSLVCTSQGIDTTKSNAAGRFQLDVLMAVAAFERGLIRERTCAGLVAARKRGSVLGRPSPKMVGVDKAAVVATWRVETEGSDYRELGRRLGGVGPGTAWRVVKALAKNKA